MTISLVNEISRLKEIQTELKMIKDEISSKAGRKNLTDKEIKKYAKEFHDVGCELTAVSMAIDILDKYR